MVDERISVLVGTTVVTVAGLQIIAHKLQWQIHPIHPPDVVVRTVEVVAQVVKYAVYGVVGLVVLAGLFFGIRHAVRTWTIRQWISAVGWIVGAGLFFWGMLAFIIPLIVAGILGVWVGALTTLTAPEE